ncbi:MAG: hypothetical protein QME93_01735 [Bacillota bacterium]|nr:hypothetical protein [Bacillota bacterium]MDI7248775.1 hypothetical protein [Bacillota bacterium]
MSRRESKRVSLVKRRGTALLERPEVVGVGLGEDDRGEECLVVLVDGDLPRRARQRCLRRLRGVPTVVMETGVLKALGGPADE